jgi:hypothetical protein
MPAVPAAGPGGQAAPDGFADDPAQDAVILSVQDIRVAQEAIALAGEDSGADSGGVGLDQQDSVLDQHDSRPGQRDLAAQQVAVPAEAQQAESAPAAESEWSPYEPPPDTAQRGAAAGGSGGSPPRPAALPRRPVPARRVTRPEPSWATVLATTIRLWWQRQVRTRAARPRWRLTAVIVVLAVLALAGLITAAVTRGAGHGTGSASPSASGSASQGAAVSPAEARAAAAARRSAAAWVAQQITPGAVVSCDPQMCANLEQAGLQAANLVFLGVGTAGPLESDVLVSTAAVRREYAARLGSVYAPGVLASFGTGSAEVAVRVVARQGAAAYAASLQADQAARASAGRQLTHNPRLRLPAAVRQALAAGQVDARLLTDLAALATLHLVRVVDFVPAPGSPSTGMPLRTADIAPNGGGTLRNPNGIHALIRFLRAQRALYRPSITEFRLPGGHPALHVEFTAPSPLGLLGKG